uniref:lysophospholipid acyltransferase family protein n=1 Tax=Aliarcobacter sp. TaxID=2321116 RepID=UPI004047C686
MKNYFKFTVIPYLLYFLVKIIYFTNKKAFHHPQLDDDEAFIFIAWHGDLLSQPMNYYHVRPNKIVKTMISKSKDGEIIAKVYSLLGIDSIRGSSSKGATKALISTIREIKSGIDVALTPDGPRGPRFTVADGVIAIAQKSGARIIVLNSKPSKYWQFDSWDKFVLPKLFGKIDFYMSEPFDISDLEFEDARNFIKDKMMENAII